MKLLVLPSHRLLAHCRNQIVYLNMGANVGAEDFALLNHQGEDYLAMYHYKSIFVYKVNELQDYVNQILDRKKSTFDQCEVKPVLS